MHQMSPLYYMLMFIHATVIQCLNLQVKTPVFLIFIAALWPETWQTVRDGDPRTSASTLTQLLSSKKKNCQESPLSSFIHLCCLENPSMSLKLVRAVATQSVRELKIINSTKKNTLHSGKTVNYNIQPTQSVPRQFSSECTPIPWRAFSAWLRPCKRQPCQVWTWLGKTNPLRHTTCSFPRPLPMPAHYTVMVTELRSNSTHQWVN